MDRCAAALVASLCLGMLAGCYPSAPSGVAAEPDSCRVALRWTDNSKDEDGFEVGMVQ
ncbi:MAG: hypothetical protein HYY16_12975 [Planctomycetes bacterium]|nr:hypothetical protein [Planctomycetota bacterium]